jgi:HPt (histidine-containing phosphotransfer) domain-containing protein
VTAAANRAAADARLVAERLAVLADDTGMAVSELQAMWLSETAERLALAVAALSAGDLSEVVRLVHSAAGTTGICGAAALATDLTSIEHLAAAGRAADARLALGSAQDEFHRLSSLLNGSLRH